MDTEGDNKRAIASFKAAGFDERSKHVWLAKTLRRPARIATGGRRRHSGRSQDDQDAATRGEVA